MASEYFVKLSCRVLMRSSLFRIASLLQPARQPNKPALYHATHHQRWLPETGSGGFPESRFSQGNQSIDQKASDLSLTGPGTGSGGFPGSRFSRRPSRGKPTMPETESEYLHSLHGCRVFQRPRPDQRVVPSLLREISLRAKASRLRQQYGS
ncbi:uncharacterized protein LOC143207789 [Lasioglossum baleicum]|uniref:uncharacterized protein LOC143207789 n=1 Tax=Lasioglossum baleicum TaxID=434251 RepID=UPI003FCD2E2B